MDKKMITVKKNSGELVPFEMHKLEESLRNSGATNQEIKKIVEVIQPEIYDGISTKLIYRNTFRILKKLNQTSASKYSLKRAIFELGPTGYPFEKLISALLKEKGYTTKVSVVLNGKCITHEIDVLAEKDGNVYTVECKFHTDSKAVSNVKVPLYINSRFLDVQEQWNTDSQHKTHLKQGWLVTNTRFTKDAIDYGGCVGLTLLSWDYPKDNGIKTNIDSYGLYPITAINSLTKKEKQELIATNIILIKELYYKPEILKEINISANRIKFIKNEIGTLLNYNNGNK